MFTAEATTSVHTSQSVDDVLPALLRFIAWLDRYGETSYDYQSYFSSRWARAAKAIYYRRPPVGTLMVAPMIFSEAFVPSARCLFWKRQRFPIADAHYAMGFALLSIALNEKKYYERALHFLEVLEETRCKGYRHYCWGYPFDWETRYGTMKAGTPLITTVPYVYEAFLQMYEVDRNPRWLEIMSSIAEHVYSDYHEETTSAEASSCSYNPEPDCPCFVVNASAYRAYLLTRASVDFSEPKFAAAAKRNLNYVLESQSEDGSWRYATDGGRDFVDHFHTCFVLKALAKIEALTGIGNCTSAIERGVQYYVANLFDADGTPRPFSRRPRLTVYKRELYDYAECINLVVLLGDKFPALNAVLSRALDLQKWQKPDGSFRSRQLLFGWDNTPMHRWAQSQYFRSLSLLLHRHLSAECKS